MSILQKIDTDYIEAYKSRDELRVSVLRLLKSALKNLSIAIGQDLTDEEAIRVVRREMKQREEAITRYKEGGRGDLAEKEKKEMTVLGCYLPAPLPEGELRQLVIETAAKEQIDHLGRLIGAVINKTQGRAESALVAKLVSEYFQNKK